MLKTWCRALPVALMAGFMGQAPAQSLPVAEFNAAEPEGMQLDPPASPASAPTFTQLSAAPAAAARPARAVAPPTAAARATAIPLDNEHGALWLPLAGVAALAFVARRNRRAFSPASQPRSA